MPINEQIISFEKNNRILLDDNDFKRLSNFITSELGIKMPDVKRTMLQCRLHKRIIDLQKSSFKEYLDFVFGSEGHFEKIILTDIVTTNKTDFFREPIHFNFLTENVLPEYLHKGQKSLMKVWSAGCSSGEEPYTIAMVMAEFRERCNDFDFQVIATDISTRMLEKAALAIYSEERVAPVEENLRKKYILRSKSPQNRTVRVNAQLRNKVYFSRLNFMDDNYEINDLFDAIFCRNVLIYFDRPTQESVIQKLCTKLKPGGFFFLGHSESISNFRVPLKQVKSTIFYKI